MLGRLLGVWAMEFARGALYVFVEARKSTGAFCVWPALELGLDPAKWEEGGLIEVSWELEPGRDWWPLDGGRMEPSALKKLDVLLVIDGDGGMLCKVSIVLSDRDAFRGRSDVPEPCSSASSIRVSPSRSVSSFFEFCPTCLSACRSAKNV